MSFETHRYGPSLKLLQDSVLQSWLMELCSQETGQPRINELVERIYRGLLAHVVREEFPTVVRELPTRMAQDHPREGVLKARVLNPETRVVSVNLARAGTLPSHICYSELNYLLRPTLVRQDHISIARVANAAHQVQGSEVLGHKIGGPVDGAIVLFPDPMAATGSTLREAVELYSRHGKAAKMIAMHCIVTPEYLRNVQKALPELKIYAVRVDRGLSPPDVLEAVPGTHWDRERGLNDRQYIVPGGGGFGEILNNAYV